MGKVQVAETGGGGGGNNPNPPLAVF